MPGLTHLQNSGYWGRRQVAKNGRMEVVRCLVEICPPLFSLHCNAVLCHEILVLPKAKKFAYKKKSGGSEVTQLASLVVRQPQMVT